MSHMFSFSASVCETSVQDCILQWTQAGYPYCIKVRKCLPIAVNDYCNNIIRMTNDYVCGRFDSILKFATWSKTLDFCNKMMLLFTDTTSKHMAMP